MAILNRLYPERPVQIVLLVLLLAQAALMLGHVGAIILDTAAPSAITMIIREFFGLSTEGNAPTWFSSLLFTLISLACGATYWAEGCQPPEHSLATATRPAWLAFAALFLFLSFDETSQFHERLDWVMSTSSEGGSDAVINKGSEGSPFYQYLLIYVPVLGTFGIAMAWFVIRRFQRPATAFMFLAGMGGFALKLVIEAFEKWSLSQEWFGHSIYLEAVVIEMSCLFTGATLILASLLSYLSGLTEGAFMFRDSAAKETRSNSEGAGQRAGPSQRGQLGTSTTLGTSKA